MLVSRLVAVTMTSSIPCDSEYELEVSEINDHLPDEISETDQVDEIISIIHDMGIKTYDEAPDAENLLMDDAPTPVTDEEAAEEAEQALATVDSEFGRTTDPVRMYMREMGKKLQLPI